MALVICGGTIVTAVDCYEAQVRIEGEQITAIGSNLLQAGDQVLDAAGCYLFPGGIDAHTHFDLPMGDYSTIDDFTSGSRAAIAGGTTTIIDFATQFRGESLALAWDNWNKRAAGRCFTDYAFHMAITDWQPQTAAQMAALVSDAGVSSFKLYMAYKNILQVDDSILFQALRVSAATGALVGLHCENGDLIDLLVREAREQGQQEPLYHPRTRPAAIEAEAVARALRLAQLAGAPLYIVHLSTADGLLLAEQARRQGQTVYLETCPHYLLLDKSRYNETFDSARYVCSPPLRSSSHQEALWSGVSRGVVDTIATDHCAFTLQEQKKRGRYDFSKIPNGMPGVEERLGMLYTYGVAAGRISLNRFVSLVATRPAKLFGLFPRKGTIAVGSDADIVVWNPAVEKLITVADQQSRCDYNPYEGFRQIGQAVHVLLRGNMLVKDGHITHSGPIGQYIPRKPYPKGRD